MDRAPPMIPILQILLDLGLKPCMECPCFHDGDTDSVDIMVNSLLSYSSISASLDPILDAACPEALINGCTPIPSDPNLCMLGRHIQFSQSPQWHRL